MAVHINKKKYSIVKVKNPIGDSHIVRLFLNQQFVIIINPSENVKIEVKSNLINFDERKDSNDSVFFYFSQK